MGGGGGVGGDHAGEKVETISIEVSVLTVYFTDHMESEKGESLAV